LLLPDLRLKDKSRRAFTDLDLNIGDMLHARLEKKKVKARVIEIQPKLHVAYLSYEEYPSIYDEFQPIEDIRSLQDGQELNTDELKAGMIVVNKWGASNEEYRAVIKFILCEKMVKVKFFGLGPDVNRWIHPSSILGIISPKDEKGSTNLDASKTLLKKTNSSDTADTRVASRGNNLSNDKSFENLRQEKNQVRHIVGIDNASPDISFSRTARTSRIIPQETVSHTQDEDETDMGKSFQEKAVSEHKSLEPKLQKQKPSFFQRVRL